MRSHRNLSPLHDDRVDDAPVVRPDLLGLFCQRCGKHFRTARIEQECPPCLYASVPTRVVLGANQGVPA